MVTLGRLRREDARPADLLRQQAAGPQRRVADQLGLQPHARAAGQQPVVRVVGQQLRRHPRGLPVGRAGHDQPVQLLERPAACGRTRRPASRAVRGGSAARPGSRSPAVVRTMPGRRRPPTGGSPSPGRSAGCPARPASGRRSEASLRARPCRRAAAGPTARPARRARVGWRNSPRWWRNVGRGLFAGRSCITSVVG